jgi:hypothetical protein
MRIEDGSQPFSATVRVWSISLLRPRGALYGHQGDAVGTSLVNDQIAILRGPHMVDDAGIFDLAPAYFCRKMAFFPLIPSVDVT